MCECERGGGGGGGVRIPCYTWYPSFVLGEGGVCECEGTIQNVENRF